ncbi:MAG: MBL fold metallo-hydrolase [Pseudomonadota bacterium]
MFLKKMGQVLAGAGAAVLSAGLGPACSSNGTAPSPAARAAAGNMTLMEIAQNKLHHRPGGFVNLFSDQEYRDLSRFLKWKLFSENKFKKFYSEEKTIPVQKDWGPVHRHQGLSVTFVKHASLLVRDQGRTVLIDPVFGNIFPLFHDFSPLSFDLAAMPEPDLALITHGHYDHLDVDSLKSLPASTRVITPLGHDEVFSDIPLKRTKLDWFESFQGAGYDIILAPANHWTMRNPLTGPNTSLWGAYIVKTPSGRTLFFSGDSAYFSGFAELGRLFDFDLAVFNLGAYEPRWFMKNHHLDPAEAVKSFRELGARLMTAVHWGAYRLGDEPVHFPPRELRREMIRAGLEDRLVDLAPGETLFFEADGAVPGVPCI